MNKDIFKSPDEITRSLMYFTSSKNIRHKLYFFKLAESILRYGTFFKYPAHAGLRVSLALFLHDYAVRMRRLK